MGKNRILTVELKDGEKVKDIIRETFLVVIPRLVLVTIYFVVIFFFLTSLIAFGTIGIVGFGVLFLFGVGLIARKIFLWYMNAFIVTTDRIIDLEQKNFLDKHISEIAHYKVDNIHYSVKGVFHNIFRCGDLFIQSHKGVTYLRMRNVRKPSRLQSHLLNLIDELSDKKKLS